MVDLEKKTKRNLFCKIVFQPNRFTRVLDVGLDNMLVYGKDNEGLGKSTLVTRPSSLMGCYLINFGINLTPTLKSGHKMDYFASNIQL